MKCMPYKPKMWALILMYSVAYTRHYTAWLDVQKTSACLSIYIPYVFIMPTLILTINTVIGRTTPTLKCKAAETGVLNIRFAVVMSVPVERNNSVFGDESATASRAGRVSTAPSTKSVSIHCWLSASTYCLTYYPTYGSNPWLHCIILGFEPDKGPRLSHSYRSREGLPLWQSVLVRLM